MIETYVMNLFECDNISIVIRGKISEWTTDIIREYEAKFHNCEIIVSTWNNENTDDIPCKIVKSVEPKMSSPHKSMINHQTILAKEGLKKTSNDIVMVCRSDQFIHSQNIFNIFKNKCPKTKILVTSVPGYLNGAPNDYRYEYAICDFCQIAKNNLMHDFWDYVPYFDGSRSISVAKTLTKNYVKNIKKDSREWKNIKDLYFYEINYYRDFQIEWEKPDKSELYANFLNVRKLIRY